MGIVVGLEWVEHRAAERRDLAFRKASQDAIEAEVVEDRDGTRPLPPASDLERTTGLAEGALELEWVMTRRTDPDAHDRSGETPGRLGLESGARCTKLGRG